MGEYADLEIDRGFDELGNSGDINDYVCDYFQRRRNNFKYFNFEYIKKETPKALLVVMTGGAEQWIPKSVCVVHDNKTISIYEWFVDSVSQKKSEEIAKINDPINRKICEELEKRGGV